MKYRYCLFDLDGTLTDPGIGITDSVMYALKKFDIDVKDRSELYSFIGPPLDYSFKTYFGFTEEQAVLAIKNYREFFSTKGLYENEVYEGIPGMLEELKKRGVTVALATSKPYEFSVEILRYFGLSGYFDHVGAATMDGRISKKEDVISNLLGQLNYEDKACVLMVGDRYHDIEGAKANGLHSAGVLWGYGTEEELKKAGAEYLFARPEDILRLF